jgi:hypothetical protein
MLEPLGPPDPFAPIARRVRRRSRIAMAGAMVVVAGVSVASLIGSGSGRAPTGLAPAIVLEPDGCPPATATAPHRSDTDRPGSLVPENPIEVVLCERPTPGPQPPSWDPDPVAQRQLRDGAAEFAALLNQAPTAEALLAAARERAAREGVDVGQLEIGCTSMWYPTVISFVLRYKDGQAVPVLVDQNCASLYADGRTRFYGGLFEPVEEFLRRYRDQLATADPATIATPACPESIPTVRLDRRQLPSGPRDDIARNRGSLTNGLLPNEVVALAACRYAVTAGGAHLVADRQSRMPGDLRQIINRQADAPSPAPGFCGRPYSPLPTVLDVVTVVDATGVSLEMWVYRAPCAAVVVATGRNGAAPDPGLNGAAPDPDLLTFLDGMLGPPGVNQ